MLIPYADNDFIFRAHRQLPMEGTWGIEACDMNWLFSNNDGTMVRMLSDESVLMMGQSGFDVELAKVKNQNQIER